MKALLLFLLPILLCACSKPSAMVDADAQILHTALKQYAMMNGAYPAGDAVAITRAIKGEPPRRINHPSGFTGLNFPPERTSSDGRLLDPWGTPYRIDYPSPDSDRVTSAGPDRKFDTADDIVSPRSSPFLSPSR